jgi:hypothetical protein
MEKPSKIESTMDLNPNKSDSTDKDEMTEELKERRQLQAVIAYAMLSCAGVLVLFILGVTLDITIGLRQSKILESILTLMGLAAFLNLSRLILYLLSTPLSITKRAILDLEYWTNRSGSTTKK